ncbi:hypothetical protein LO762_26475 [Actinocorallia sp. API 0066]|uniref:hypothetical protein n=1 Tax=Actinocorallia sp. API 0066 TaxID=2896846 RepID=UPI001E37CEEB|nr:hypothetical protein [Actinocorallia sp. API 0066]MCD0452701.1 hypothetical protein [Actinocorallia sp. API 0066]
MRRVIITGLAALALGLGLAQAPASADNPYTPSEADFADCPAKPAGASDWTCFVMTALDGQFRLKNMKARINSPYRLTIGQGNVNGSKIAVLGSLKGDPIPFVTGVLGTPLEIPDPTGWKVQIEAAGQVSPGILYPSKVGLKARLIGDGLGPNCYIGSNAAPVTLAPRIQWALPWVIGGHLMNRTKVYDDVFAIDWATGCESQLPNVLIGAANATSNHFDATWAIRTKKL